MVQSHYAALHLYILRHLLLQLKRHSVPNSAISIMPSTIRRKVFHLAKFAPRR
jgi:hypothetical protein